MWVIKIRPAKGKLKMTMHQDEVNFKIESNVC